MMIQRGDTLRDVRTGTAYDCMKGVNDGDDREVILRQQENGLLYRYDGINYIHLESSHYPPGTAEKVKVSLRVMTHRELIKYREYEHLRARKRRELAEKVRPKEEKLCEEFYNKVEEVVEKRIKQIDKDMQNQEPGELVFYSVGHWFWNLRYDGVHRGLPNFNDEVADRIFKHYTSYGFNVSGYHLHTRHKIGIELP